MSIYDTRVTTHRIMMHRASTAFEEPPRWVPRCFRSPVCHHPKIITQSPITSEVAQTGRPNKLS